jgi:mannosyltransferase OCH1-like enzyme
MNHFSTVSLKYMIPPVIHRIWFDLGKGPDLPESYRKLADHCNSLNVGWTEKQWDKSKAEKFVGKYFPDFLKVYRSYTYEIQRIDVLRYLIMYQIGGVYLDADIECLKPFKMDDQTKVYLIKENDYLFPTTYLNNYFLASPPKHPFWKFMIDRLKEAYYQGISYVSKVTQVLYQTGPGFLSQCYKDYETDENQSSIIILPAKEYNPIDICGKCKSGLDKAFIIHHTDGGWNDNKWTGAIFKHFYCQWTDMLYNWIFLTVIIFLVIFFFNSKNENFYFFK